MEAFRRAAKRVADRTDDQQLDCALMASVQKQLTEVADAVAAVRPLAELPDPERRECAKTSAVKRYAARSVVYDDNRDSSRADTHFVLEGRCTSVQRLHVRKTSTAFGREHFTLVPDGRARDEAGRTVYVKMSDLGPGSVFGLGEKRPGRLVVATTEVRCLLVPLAFLAKHNASNIWGRTVCALDASEPTAEQSFRKFVVDNRWEEYKRSLAAEILGNRDRPSPSRPPWRR